MTSTLTTQEHLDRVQAQTQRITRLRQELETAYEERGDEFLAAVEDDPELQVVTLARAAGNVTGPAVSQQIEKARARRAARAEAQP